MDLLQTIAGMFGTNQRTAGAQGVPNDDAQGIEGLKELLGPTALGGLAGVLFGGKGGAMKGAALAGAGTLLWNHYKKRFREENTDDPQYEGGAFSPPAERGERMIRALIYAARADGHVDQDEQDKLQAAIQSLNLGKQADRIVSAAMNEPVDPATVAKGIMDEEEALQIFTLSCSALTIDNFMEKSYLRGLADALHIPEDVRDDIMTKTHPA
ncbi:MAG: DUF533 domain-containing protein [Planctomycetaceae bacterium]|nr:DUF533 domain-containing protein [Planctomycetaceae bacterium]